MIEQLNRTDIIVFILMLSIMPLAGVVVALRNKNAEKYFLAGRSVKWWGVAGSIFGTNISSFHLIGMLGVGYSIGFVQTHYEIVFPAVLLLCYVFVQTYRKLNVFTLSEYLEVRFNETARLIYTLLLVTIILVQLVGAFYVGSITLQWLLGGSSFELSYVQGLILIGLITCSYTLWGGMESIVVTDSIQTILMLLAGITVAYFTFSQPEINGFSGLLALDAAQEASERKMHLYLPTNHPNLPWTGIFTGLMLQHCFNFTTNQFLVQRVLAAKTDADARKGVIASGFLKLLIPFFSISAGVAAYYLFKARFGNSMDLTGDNTFMKLVETVIPKGVGLTGMILAGLTAATFSSVDSMMNAATTLLSVDVYKKYMNKQASDNQLVKFGRIVILCLVLIAILLAWLTFTPDKSSNFFLKISAMLSYFTPGIMSVFFFGVLWKKTSGRAAVVALIAAPIFAYGVEVVYEKLGGTILFGPKLNFMHRVALTFTFSSLVLLVLSALKPADGQQHKALQLDVDFKVIFRNIVIFLGIQIGLFVFAVVTTMPQQVLAPWAAAGALVPFVVKIKDKDKILQDDLFWAGLLTAISIFIYYYFA
jgi:solute:Na+ symporter, SSS family